MYIMINDIIGSKTIDLSYPIRNFDSRKEIAVVSFFSKNVQYWVTGDDLKFELKTGKEVSLLKGMMYTDEELNATIGLEYKSTMLRNNYGTKKNKLGDITEMVISLNELDNSNNLEDGRPSSTLFTYYVIDPKDFTCFEPQTQQYRKLKNGELTSLNLRITDQNGDIIAKPVTTVVLHIRQLKCTSLLMTSKVKRELTYLTQFRILTQTRKSQLSEC